MSSKKKGPVKPDTPEPQAVVSDAPASRGAPDSAETNPETTTAVESVQVAKVTVGDTPKPSPLSSLWDAIRSHVTALIAVGVGAVLVGLFVLLGDAVKPKIKNYMLGVLISELPKDKDGNPIFKDAMESYIVSTIVQTQTTKGNINAAMTEYILSLLSSEDLSKVRGYEKLKDSIRLLIKDELTRLQNIQDSYSRVDTIIQRGFLYDRDNTSVENSMNFPMFEIFAYKGQEVAIHLEFADPSPNARYTEAQRRQDAAPPTVVLSGANVKFEFNKTPLQLNRHVAITDLLDWDNVDGYQKLKFNVEIGNINEVKNYYALTGQVYVYVYNKI